MTAVQNLHEVDLQEAGAPGHVIEKLHRCDIEVAESRSTPLIIGVAAMDNAHIHVWSVTNFGNLGNPCHCWLVCMGQHVFQLWIMCKFAGVQ